MSNIKVPLLEEALAAHGGEARWREFTGLSSTIVTGGKLWPLKGVDLGDTPRRVITDFRRQWAQFTPFGSAADWTMTWEPHHVEVRDGSNTLIGERDNGRDTIDRAFDAPWDPLSLAYFNGYAMWTYHAAPFIFSEPGYAVAEIGTIDHERETLRGLSVRFPDEVHTHTREQRFFFAEDGLLRRHDYEVDVLADSPAVHLLSDYVDVEGLKFPTRRTVYVRNADGTPNYDVNTVTIALSDYALR